MLGRAVAIRRLSPVMLRPSASKEQGTLVPMRSTARDENPQPCTALRYVWRVSFHMSTHGVAANRIRTFDVFVMCWFAIRRLQFDPASGYNQRIAPRRCLQAPVPARSRRSSNACARDAPYVKTGLCRRSSTGAMASVAFQAAAIFENEGKELKSCSEQLTGLLADD